MSLDQRSRESVSVFSLLSVRSPAPVANCQDLSARLYHICSCWLDQVWPGDRPIAVSSLGTDQPTYRAPDGADAQSSRMPLVRLPDALDTRGIPAWKSISHFTQLARQYGTLGLHVTPPRRSEIVGIPSPNGAVRRKHIKIRGAHGSSAPSKDKKATWRSVKMSQKKNEAISSGCHVSLSQTERREIPTRNSFHDSYTPRYF